jgi:hypothetical protein
MHNRKVNQKLMENNLLEYSLISILIILFHTVLSGIYLIKKERKGIYKEIKVIEHAYSVLTL